MGLLIRGYWGLVSFIAGISLALILYLSYDAKQSVLEEYATKHEGIVRIVHKSINEMFSQYDLVLDVVGRELFLHNNPNNAESLVTPTLKHLMRDNPSIVGFGFAKTNGQLIYTSFPAQEEKLPNLLDIESCRGTFLQAMQSDNIVIGRTYYFEPLHQWLVPVRKAIRDSNGRLLGVMNAGIGLDKNPIFQTDTLFAENERVQVLREDNYFMFRIEKNYDKSIFEKPLPAEFVANITSSIESKYGLSIDVIKNTEKVVNYTGQNIKGEEVFIAIQYNKKHRVWVISQVDYASMQSKWVAQILLYLAVYLIAMTIFIFLVRLMIRSQAQHEQKLTHQANHDSQTSLLNRSYLLSNHHEWIYKGAKPFMLLLLDVKHFKHINDMYGHRFGDKVLKGVGERLSQLFANQDLVIRYGSDEFVILSKALQDIHTLHAKIEKSLLGFEIEGVSLTIRLNLSLAYYPDDATTLESLIKKADVAMIEAKKSGEPRNYVTQMENRYLDNIAIEQGLLKALENNEMHLVFQPQLYPDGSLHGAEALLRWHNPTLGNVSPARFIPIAEESGLMHKLGDFVLRSSLAQTLELYKELGRTFQIAINISIQQYIEHNFYQALMSLTEELGFDRKLITLEITESIFIEDTEYILTLLHRLKKSGFKLSLDDFGTGYSSLSLLKRLPIDELKIDKSFVDEIEHDYLSLQLLSSIITIGQNLHFQILAEGVETRVQKELLDSIGCGIYQGFHFAKPLPKEQFVEFCKTR